MPEDFGPLPFRIATEPIVQDVIIAGATQQSAIAIVDGIGTVRCYITRPSSQSWALAAKICDALNADARLSGSTRSARVCPQCGDCLPNDGSCCDSCNWVRDDSIEGLFTR